MPNTTIFDLSNQIDAERFLKDFWQKKPCVIKNAWPDFECPIDENELAGLSLEEDVESRIISNIDNNWQLQQGPFNEQTFSELPEHNWTLLIQGCDHFVEEIHQMRSYFNFLPSWLLDDVMISFATDQGSVGPHYDQFNVFLLQASGKRTWHLAKEPFQQKPDFIEPLPVKVLKTMPQYQVAQVQNGDLIYIPPGFAHHGVSQGNSISLSFGYRGPSMSEAIGQIGFTVDEQSNEFSRLSFNTPVTHHCKIDQEHINLTRKQIIESLSDDVIAQFLGQSFTELKDQEPCNSIEKGEFIEEFNQGAVLVKNLNTRLSFSENCLFANGESFSIPSHVSKIICDFDELSQGDIDDNHLELIHNLFELGVYYFD